MESYLKWLKVRLVEIFGKLQKVWLVGKNISEMASTPTFYSFCLQKYSVQFFLQNKQVQFKLKMLPNIILQVKKQMPRTQIILAGKYFSIFLAKFMNLSWALFGGLLDMHLDSYSFEYRYTSWNC